MSRIFITCPKCGNEQNEPSRVLSCYCRSCRSHLDIERDGVAWRNAEQPANASLLTRIRAFIKQRPTSKPATPVARQRPKIRTAVVPTAETTCPPEEPSETISGKPLHPAGTPAAVKRETAPVTDKNTPGQGRAPKFRSERILTCYACRETFPAPKLGPAPACPSCGKFFPSMDKVIEEPTSEDFHTYGNVRLLSRGALTGKIFRSHHLAAYGQLGGDIQCSGRVECNVSGTMNASIRCRELIIPRKVNIEFTGIVEADHIEVQGEITARALINGELVVGSGGVFNGEVVTRTLSIEDDAELNASVRIDTDPASLRGEFETAPAEVQVKI